MTGGCPNSSPRRKPGPSVFVFGVKLIYSGKNQFDLLLMKRQQRREAGFFKLVFKEQMRYKYLIALMNCAIVIIFAKISLPLNFLRGFRMKTKWVLGLILTGWIVSLWSAIPASAQNSPMYLTILYSNNINGEIDPCPT
jgi:hypothetical protein